jgi:hypothetical protein
VSCQPKHPEHQTPQEEKKSKESPSPDVITVDGTIRPIERQAVFTWMQDRNLIEFIKGKYGEEKLIENKMGISLKGPNDSTITFNKQTGDIKLSVNDLDLTKNTEFMKNIEKELKDLITAYQKKKTTQ